MPRNSLKMSRNGSALWGHEIIEEFIQRGAFSSAPALRHAHASFGRLASLDVDSVDEAVWRARGNSIALWALICLELQKTDKILHAIIDRLHRRHDSWQGQLIFTLFAFNHNSLTNVVRSQRDPSRDVIEIDVIFLKELQGELFHVIWQIAHYEGMHTLHNDRLEIKLRGLISSTSVDSPSYTPQRLVQVLLNLAAHEIDEAIFLLRILGLVDDETLEESATRGFLLASYFLAYSWPATDYRAYRFFRKAAGVYMTREEFEEDPQYGHALSYLGVLHLARPLLPTSIVTEWHDGIPGPHLELLVDIVDDAVEKMREAREAQHGRH